MQKIEINTPEPQKVLPVLRDAIERQTRILSQSLILTEERIHRTHSFIGCISLVESKKVERNSKNCRGA